ncbi:hypothetical protein [Estrella lausannensis]|uniref:Uncharacterized protein n=1 Tax=Estrella lausannensis TaxID=483423 RepID=A0A0H5DSC2_9BACT|nr:hypothetical protein [Estrella lausannensis]CRX39582.1 hypothetical protein ELAC_p0005 [Estrella lausannensis]
MIEGEPYDFEYYDHDELDKFKARRSEKYVRLVKAYSQAKTKSDEKATKKAATAILRFREEEDVIKEKCRATGYFWS